MYFSVIVPIYNVEPYLPICVDSILAQTFRNFELILVDDGSTDGSPILCDAYARKDSRVRVIHQPNAGVVAARNAGLRTARGGYVLFVDGDDWVSPQYLQHGQAIIEETRAELLLFSCHRVYEIPGGLSETVFEPASEGLYDRETARSAFFPSLLMDPHMRHTSYSCSGKLFRRELAEQGLFSVDSHISLGEDLLSVLSAFLKARSIYVSQEVMCFFRIRNQSASHGFQLKHYQQVELVLEALEELLQKASDLPEDFSEQLARYGAYMCFTLMIHAVNDGQRAILSEIKAQMNYPHLQACIQGARFHGITPKTRIALALLRKGQLVLAYTFLRLCRRVKSLMERGELGCRNCR